MSAYISSEFGKLAITIGDKQVVGMERLLIGFETRGSHALALNDQVFGVHPIVFTDADRAAFFSLFGVSEDQVRATVRHIPSIDPSHNVASDPFNLLSFWVIHLSYLYLKSEKVRHAFQLNVAKYLHYRFFTSAVNHYLRHGANEAIMRAAINQLTRRHDIIVYGSWRAAIAARCEDLIGPTSIHRRAFERADDDSARPGGIVYVITDTQTRVRDKLKNILDVYYDVKEHGGAVNNRSNVSEIDGEKVLVQATSTFDAVTANLAVEVLNVNTFVDKKMVAFVAKQFSALPAPMLEAALNEMSIRATAQAATRTLDLTETHDGKTLHIGMRALIIAVVQSSFRYCIANGISFNDKVVLFIRLKNIYSSSRIADANINQVKESVWRFVTTAGITQRETTLSSLRLAVILYLILRSYRYLK